MIQPAGGQTGRPAQKITEQMQDITVASYNMHKGIGRDRRRDPARTTRVIGELGADIVALQEADRRFGNRAGVLDLGRLRALTGLSPVPIEGRGRAHGWHGNLLLVREEGIEIEDVHQVDLPGFEPRGALMVTLRWHGHPLRVIGAHLGLLRASRLVQARMLDALLQEGDDIPTLLLGDFNEWRRARRSSLEPLALSGTGRDKLVASFPARYPLLPLDRILTCPAADILELTSHESPLARVASDHLPIRARVRLNRPDDTSASDSRRRGTG